MSGWCYALQVAPPFGQVIGGTNPSFWGYDKTLQYDSWLTVGPVNQSTLAHKLSSVGFNWDPWYGPDTHDLVWV
jgi:hypothetical protein